MNYSEMLFNRDEKIIKIIEEKDKEINKLTAESTEWEERTYCWQDRAENLQIVLDKIKKYILEHCEIILHEEENTTEVGKVDGKKLLEILEEIE